VIGLAVHLSRADLVCGWLAKLLCLATIVAGSSAHANNCTQFGAVNETLTRGNGHLHLNLFFSELPPSGGPKEPIALLRKVVERSASQFAFVATPEKKSPAGPWYYAKVVQDASKLPRMSMEYLQFKGRTLTEPQKLAASSPKALLLVGFVIPEKDFAKNFRAANEVGEAVARATGTLLSDDDTRDVYAPDTWRAARLKGAGSALTVGDHLAIHLYRKGEHLRAVTLGMSKFGLPELAIDEMAGGENWPAGTLLNVLSQRLYESPATVTMGRFNLSLSDLQSSPWRTEIQSSLVAPAKGEGELCLYDAKPEPGDADNRLLRLGFELSAGSDRHSQRNAFFGLVVRCTQFNGSQCSSQ
jgi:hypothetical protein